MVLIKMSKLGLRLVRPMARRHLRQRLRVLLRRLALGLVVALLAAWRVVAVYRFRRIVLCLKMELLRPASGLKLPWYTSGKISKN